MPLTKTTLDVYCDAPDSVFVENYDDVPYGHKLIIEKQGGLPCDGGGVPGEWCFRTRKGHKCVFVGVDDSEWECE